MTGDQWFTIIITLGSALVAAGSTLAASLLTQGRTKQAELARHWADRRVEIHQRFMAAIEDMTSELVPGIGEGQEVDDHVLVELRAAGREVAIFGSKATADAAQRVVELTEATWGALIPNEPGDRYGLAEMVNDGYKGVVDDYRKAMRKELGTEH